MSLCVAGVGPNRNRLISGVLLKFSKKVVELIHGVMRHLYKLYKCKCMTRALQESLHHLLEALPFGHPARLTLGMTAVSAPLT